jgi:hypothetical protein
MEKPIAESGGEIKKNKKMFCPNCGVEVSEKAIVCIKCGVGLKGASLNNVSLNNVTPQPKTWLVESILVTLFCCLPFGIAGIVNAANVSSRYGAGDYDGAMRASQQAGNWTKISFWIGIAGLVIYIIFWVIYGAAMFSLFSLANLD